MAKQKERLMITRSMIDKDGKVTLVPVDGKGTPIRRWPVDAVEIVAQGDYKLAEAEQTVSEAAKEAENAPSDEIVRERVREMTSVPAPESAAVDTKEPEFEYDIPATAPRK